MAIDNVQVSNTTDKYGNSYTTAVSNDTLTNDDFLKLMLTEMKYQDPTKPMDSASMMDSQLKMSSIEANSQMAESIKSLEKTFGQTSMSTAINYMGKKIDAIVDVPQKDSNGNVMKDSDDNILYEKVRAPFKVSTVESFDGTIKLNAQEYLGIEDRIMNQETGKMLRYNGDTGQIENEDGSLSDYYVKLDGSRFDASTGAMVITDANGTVVDPQFSTDPDDSSKTASQYGNAGPQEVYNPNFTTIDYLNVVKIYS